MKKLYVNVDRCEVMGGAQALAPIVQEMDRRLQEFASETERMKGVLFKFYSTNSSEQFQKAATSIYNLSEFLVEAAEQLNEMQNQIVKYQNAIARYNDNSYSFAAPNAHNVKKVRIDINTNHFQFTYDDMIYVNQSIQKYTNDARDTVKHLKANKEEIGSIWKDPQYRDFSDFIDDIVSKAENSISVLEEYSRYLDRKITELKN